MKKRTKYEISQWIGFAPSFKDGRLLRQGSVAGDGLGDDDRGEGTAVASRCTGERKSSPTPPLPRRLT